MMIDFLKSHGIYSDEKYFKDLTTLKMGGHIKHFVMPNSVDDLKEIIEYLKTNKVPFKIIGNGSNLICGESEFDGVVINLKRIDSYEISNDEIYVEAGVMAPAIANILAKQGLSCLEFASGIPGTIGGLVYMNAGAYKCDMANVVNEVLVLRDGEISWITNEECEFAYRRSIFQNHPRWVILAAKLKLVKKSNDEIEDLMADRLQRRKQSQPLDMPSAGSCFRNPENGFAWKLIDSIGYRGKNRNDVVVSPKHSNFLVNTGKGTAEDYLSLALEIQDIVKDKYGIKLIMEVEKFNC